MADKLYIIRKYVFAPSAAIAIHRERRAPVDDVWLDDDWKKSQEVSKGNVGFQLKPKNVRVRAKTNGKTN